MRLAFTIVVLTAAAILAWVSPKLFGMLAAVVGAALAVRYMNRSEPDPQRPPAPEAEADPEAPAQSRENEAVAVRQALDLARRELGHDETGELAPIDLQTSLGRAQVHVGYASDVPFIGLRQPMGEDTEMAFVIRRRHSTLGLPRLVDNTPIATAKFEYRLRTMPLGDTLAHAFDAGTNRPRLFRELLAGGLGEALESVLYHPQYRLEDMVYGGDSLSLTVHPAADPTDTAWLRDTLDYAEPLCAQVRHFITVTHIPSAQS